MWEDVVRYQCERMIGEREEERRRTDHWMYWMGEDTGSPRERLPLLSVPSGTPTLEDRRKEDRPVWSVPSFSIRTISGDVIHIHPMHERPWRCCPGLAAPSTADGHDVF